MGSPVGDVQGRIRVNDAAHDAIAEAEARYPEHDPTGRADFVAGAEWARARSQAQRDLDAIFVKALVSAADKVEHERQCHLRYPPTMNGRECTCIRKELDIALEAFPRSEGPAMNENEAQRHLAVLLRAVNQVIADVEADPYTTPDITALEDALSQAAEKRGR